MGEKRGMQSHALSILQVRFLLGMKLGKRCGPYNCHNGAPFGNAALLSSVAQGEPEIFALQLICWCCGIAFLLEACLQVSILTIVGNIISGIFQLLWCCIKCTWNVSLILIVVLIACCCCCATCG